MKILFSSLLAFTAVFFLIYLPLAVLIGWYDYKKFAVPVEAALGAKASPWVRDLAKSLILMAEGKNLEAVEILKKWT